MDYEKKYKEALTKARNIVSSINVGLIGKDSFEAVFPELKESEENEMIRVIKEVILNSVPYKINILTKDTTITAEDAITWLEKQGKNNMGISEATKKKLEDNLNKALEKETPDSWNEFLDEQGEQKPAFEMKTPEESLGIDSDTYNKIVDECIYGEQKPAWSEEDENMIQALNACINAAIKGGMNYISFDSKSILIGKVKNWLKSLKDRVQPQPQQEWSEEDEERLSDAIFFVREYQIPTRDKRLLNAAKETEDWLKSLRPQNRWKPSDEQMLAIDTAINVLGKGTLNGKQLIGLQEQLKKLK